MAFIKGSRVNTQSVPLWLKDPKAKCRAGHRIVHPRTVRLYAQIGPSKFVNLAQSHCIDWNGPRQHNRLNKFWSESVELICFCVAGGTVAVVKVSASATAFACEAKSWLCGTSIGSPLPLEFPLKLSGPWVCVAVAGSYRCRRESLCFSV